MLFDSENTKKQMFDLTKENSKLKETLNKVLITYYTIDLRRK